MPNPQPKWLHTLLVLVVFTCTGLTVAWLGRQLTGWMGIERFSWQYWLFWVVGLLPIYQVILLIYAFLFGKYSYFRAKQLKLWRRMTGRKND